MAETTKISWADATASPWHGCEHATLPDGTEHPGCLNCYAEAMSVRNPGTLGVWGPGGTRIRSKKFLDKLIAWNKKAAAEDRIISVFPSICDPFEDRSELVPWRQEAFDVIDLCLNLRILALTKRPQNVRPLWPVKHDRIAPFPGMPGALGQPMPCIIENSHRPNIWLGVSASDQETWDLATIELAMLADLCPVRFVSLEPMLGTVEFSVCPHCIDQPPDYETNVVECRRCDGTGLEPITIDQVIIGCESNGPRVGRLGEFRTEQEWIDAAIRVVDQCRAAGVAVFVKQIPINGRVAHDVKEFPVALRYQQFPEVTSVPA